VQRGDINRCGWVMVSVGVRVCSLTLVLGHCRLLAYGRDGICLRLLPLFRFLLFLSKTLLLQISEVVVENEVTVLLLRQKECLHKLPPRLTVIGHFPNDMNHDAVIGARMSIDRVDEDFTFLELDLKELFVNGSLALQERSLFTFDTMKIM